METKLGLTRVLAIVVSAYISTTFLLKISGNYPDFFTVSWWMFVCLQVFSFHGLERICSMIFEWFGRRIKA
jgi:hypothetical protein